MDISLFEGFSLGITCLDYDYTELFIFAGSLDRQAKLFSLKNNNHIASFTGHIDYINACCTYLTSQMAVTGSSDKTLKEWDFDSLKLARNVIFKSYSYRLLMIIDSMQIFMFFSCRILR